MIIDDWSNFKGILTGVCEYLKMLVYLLAKRNNNSHSVEHFHRVLDKTITIASEDRGHQQSNFTAVANAIAFAWNSAAIDNTDVIRSIVAIGRLLNFPLDIRLAKILSPTLDPATDVAQDLRLVSNDYRFATEALKILLDYRRVNYRERVNRG